MADAIQEFLIQYSELFPYLLDWSYWALLIFGAGGLLFQIIFLYEEGVSQLYFGDKDIGWLMLLLIVVDVCVAMTIFVFVTQRVL